MDNKIENCYWCDDEGKAEVKCSQTEDDINDTEYAIKSRAIYDMQCILRDQPELKGKIAIKQRNFEE